MRRTFRRLTAATAVAVALTQSATAVAQAWPVTDHSVNASVLDAFDPTVVRQFSLTLLPSDWLTVQRDGSFSVYVPATMAIDGVPLAAQVLVRRKSGVPITLRGAARGTPSKIALKVDISGVDGNQRWKGLSKLSLEASNNSPIAEGIAWMLHQAASVASGYGAGYDAALANWVTLSVNGYNLGVYLSVEQRNKTFVQNRGLWNSGSTWLYKQETQGVSLEAGTAGTNSPQSSVLCFEPFNVGRACGAPTNDAALRTILDANVDMASYLTLAGINAFLGNTDTTHVNANNVFWLDSSAPGAKRRYYPWDVDQAMLPVAGLVNRNIFAIQRLPDRRGVYFPTNYERLVLNNPTYRLQYRTILYSLMAPGGPLSSASLLALVDQIEALVGPYLATDPYFARQVNQTPAAHFTWLRTWLDQRVGIVRGQLDANLPAPRSGLP